MRRPRRSSAETREHVLDVAHVLFYWNGIRATGVDKVAAEAGIAPTVPYRLFPSKDALVAEYVKRAESRYRAWFEMQTRPRDDNGELRTPEERIIALFDGLAEAVRPEQCRGCPFLMALTEMPDDSLEAHQAAVRLKRWVRARIRRLVKELALAREEVDAGALADHLTLLFEGVYATVPALGANGPARRARDLAAGVIAASR